MEPSENEPTIPSKLKLIPCYGIYDRHGAETHPAIAGIKRSNFMFSKKIDAYCTCALYRRQTISFEIFKN
jgi:hypothetical protein